MNAKEYADYRKTEAWKSMRRLVLSEYKYRCQVCGCTNWRRPVDVHHLHYKNVGKEKIGDLIPLCSVHHQLIHEQKDGYNIDVVYRLKDQCTEDFWNDPLPRHIREMYLIDGRGDEIAHMNQSSGWGRVSDVIAKYKPIPR